MKKPIPQEGLKLLACGAMLVDHWALLFGKSLWFRALGRLAFPIYCFLISEGLAHTRNRRRYFGRLALMALVTEPIYDFAFYPRAIWQGQNVLWTLLLGGVLLDRLEQAREPGEKLFWLLLLPLVGELLGVSYGLWGILLIALFGLTRGQPGEVLPQTLGMALLSLCMGSIPIAVLGMNIPVQLFSVFAMVPIGLYSGRKSTKSPWVSRAFYLFYPLHLLVLTGILRLS
mgnify:FL=1